MEAEAPILTIAVAVVSALDGEEAEAGAVAVDECVDADKAQAALDQRDDDEKDALHGQGFQVSSRSISATVATWQEPVSGKIEW